MFKVTVRFKDRMTDNVMEVSPSLTFDNYAIASKAVEAIAEHHDAVQFVDKYCKTAGYPINDQMRNTILESDWYNPGFQLSQESMIESDAWKERLFIPCNFNDCMMIAASWIGEQKHVTEVCVELEKHRHFPEPGGIYLGSGMADKLSENIKSEDTW